MFANMAAIIRVGSYGLIRKFKMDLKKLVRDKRCVYFCSNIGDEEKKVL
jgi:hypothetical protein